MAIFSCLCKNHFFNERRWPLKGSSRVWLKLLTNPLQDDKLFLLGLPTLKAVQNEFLAVVPNYVGNAFYKSFVVLLTVRVILPLWGQYYLFSQQNPVWQFTFVYLSCTYPLIQHSTFVLICLLQVEHTTTYTTPTYYFCTYMTRTYYFCSCTTLTTYLLKSERETW